MDPATNEPLNISTFQPGPLFASTSASRYHSRNRPLHFGSIRSRSDEEVNAVLHKLRTETGLEQVKQEIGCSYRRLVARTQDQHAPDAGHSDNNEGATGSGSRGKEVFIGRLPKDLLEDELFAFVTSVIPSESVLELRLMLQPESIGLNRGYAFVMVSSPEVAQKVISSLDGKDIRPGHSVGVKRSVDNNRLFIGNIPRDKTKAEFEEELHKHPICGEGIEKVIMYQDVHDKRRNRGFAFVQYPTHRQAAFLRRQMLKEKLVMWGKELCVDWAQPENEVDDSVMANVRILYVRNIAAETTEEKLRELFSMHLTEGIIERVKKQKDYAFVHFQSRADAERALDNLSGLIVDGSTIDVVWAKPSDSRVQQTLIAPRVPHSPTFNPYLLQMAASHQLPYTNAPIHQQFDYAAAAYAAQFQRNQQQQFRHYRNATGTKARFVNSPHLSPDGYNGAQYGFGAHSPFLFYGSHSGSPTFASPGYMTPQEQYYAPQYTSYPQSPIFSPAPNQQNFFPNPFHTVSYNTGSYIQQSSPLGLSVNPGGESLTGATLPLNTEELLLNAMHNISVQPVASN